MVIDNKATVIVVSLFDHIHIIGATTLTINSPIEFYELTRPLIATSLAHMNQSQLPGRFSLCFPFADLTDIKAQFSGDGKQFGEWWANVAKLYLNSFPALTMAFPVITEDVLPVSLWQFAQDATGRCGADWVFPSVHNAIACKVILGQGEGSPRIFP
jgi:hypothetical protein